MRVIVWCSHNMMTVLEGGNLCLQEEVQYVASIGTSKAGVQCNGSKRLTLQQRYQRVMSRASYAWLVVPVSLPMLHDCLTKKS